MKNGKGKPRNKNYMDETTFQNVGKPASEGSIKDHISVMALKDLAHSSYSVKADPYTAALPNSIPYPLLNRFNRMIDCKYAGDDNIDGGNVQQYANSVTSKYLKCFDSIRLKFDINYRYLPIRVNNQNIGSALIDEMRRSVAETVSVLQSSTYHAMAVNTFAVATDMNMGSATKDPYATGLVENVDYIVVGIDGHGEEIRVPIYYDQTDVIYALAIYYQLFLQEGLSVMNVHNSFRLKQGTMIRNAWNREVPTLNGFFGLMNKKAFLSMLESINLSFEGEYIDKAWMIDTNAITTIPSRRSNCMFDAVKELQVSYEHPDYFRVFIKTDVGIETTPFFSEDMLVYAYAQDAETVVTQNFFEMTAYLKGLLSMESTVKWARAVYLNPSNAISQNARYNEIKTLFDGISHCFTIFKPLWSDFREVMDTMTRTGAVSWTKGFRPGITKDTDSVMFDNKIVNDIYSLVFSGPTTIDFSNVTKRFRSWSYWNMYTGIASYDVQSGGSFLTFSFKNFTGTDEDNVFQYVPRLFALKLGTFCAAVARDGTEVEIRFNDRTLNSIVETKRLVPLTSQNTIQARVPTFIVPEGETVTDDHVSLLIKLLTQEFGICEYDSKFYVDPDIFAVYQIELEDVSNEAITYARANAPYRGTTAEKSILGMVPSMHK